MLIDTEACFTQADFGKLVGVSQPAVSDMGARGVLTPGASAGQWLLEYCGHLRETAAGRAASGDLDLLAERARLAKEQADRVALQNRITRREYAPVELLALALSGTAAQINVIFDAAPSLIRTRMPDLPVQVLDMVAGEFARARNLVADMRLDDLLADEAAPVAVSAMPEARIDG